MLNLKKNLLSLPLSAGLVLSSVSGVFAEFEVNVEKPTYGVGGVDASALVSFVINALIVLGVVLSLIFLIWGGLRWITSGGDKAKVDSARGTIVASIVGLIIVILSWVIINVVLQLLGLGGLGNFTIPTLNNTSATPTPAS